MSTADQQVVKKFKWFWNYQDAKRETWLQQMAQQGLHLRRFNWLGLGHTFDVGAAAQVVYRLDFALTSKADADYLQLFRDAGWEHVAALNGWQIWRKRIQPGQRAEIYSDAPSKITKYQRMLLVYALCMVPAVPLLGVYGTMFHEAPAFFSAVIIPYILLILLAGYDVIGLIRRIASLRKFN